MIKQLKFHNFRILKDATLPLGRVTVIIGPNGSGKSTALEGLKALSQTRPCLPVGWPGGQLGNPDAKVAITVESADPDESERFELERSSPPGLFVRTATTPDSPLRRTLRKARIFALEPLKICEPTQLAKTLEIGPAGENLASVLTTLQDQFHERFESLNRELPRWMPEFDRILLDTVEGNRRAFQLRTSVGRHGIMANQLSHGNLIAIALLTLSHLPSPPTIIGLEEIDRGIHPRLLRDVQDAVTRLAFPGDSGDDRAPAQVILTTHSPYFIDLFRDHPEDILIAEKNGLSANFHRLIDTPHMEDILRDTQLGEAWYSGVLGGVPAGS